MLQASAPACLLIPALIGAPAFAQGSPAPDSEPPPATPERPPERPVAATLPVPVIVDEVRYGNATASVTLDGVSAVQANDLADALTPLLNADTLAALRALGASMAPIEAIRATGVDVGFDPASISLRVTLPPDARAPQDFSVAAGPRFAGLDRIEPSRFALGLTGALATNARLDSGASPNTNLLLSGFANIGGADGLNALFGGDVRLTGGGSSSAFRRDRLLLFKDDQRRALRFSAGDIVPLQQRLAGQIDLLGVSVERNYQEIQPLRNVRPIGRRSFVLERRSLIEVYVNGALVQSFTAEPGAIDIRDIPLADLSNNVVIVVEDDFGRRELDNFALGSDLSLLAAGIDEFNLSLGVERDFNSGFSYSGDPILSMFYSRGLREGLTAAGHMVLAERYQNVGASAAFTAPGGIALLETAASHTRGGGAGVAFSVSYRGDPFGQAERGGFLNVRFELRSRDFREGTGAGLLDATRLDIAADYRINITERTTISVGGSYFDRYGTAGGNRGAFLGISRAFDRFTASATLRYLKQSDRPTSVGGFFTLSVPIGRNGSAYSSYDTANDTARAEYRYRRTLEFPELDVGVRARRTPDDTELGGRFGYGTSRFNAVADVSQTQRSGGADISTGTLRLQSGIALVDGHVGIGRDPGRGFLMVKRHASLRDGRVEVRSGAVGRALGTADAFGPAVIPVTAPYRPQEISVNPINAPPGYDIGAGSYVVLPGALSGMFLEVGSDAYRVVLAVLRDEEGAPLPLVTGQVRSLKSGQSIPFFSNQKGRVAFNRLAPGRYRVEVDGSERVYEFEIGEDAPALVDLGPVGMELAQ